MHKMTKISIFQNSLPRGGGGGGGGGSVLFRGPIVICYQIYILSSAPRKKALMITTIFKKMIF